jgi:hypothetical protein
MGSPPSRFGEAGSAYEPEDPEVDEPVDEVDELLLVEDDVDVLSLVDDVPEEAAGLVSPEDLAPSPAGFLA